jgi:hypothetical protein
VPTSKKQRAWAWTAAGKKALGPAKAKQWEHATNAQIAAEKKPKRKRGK